MSHAISRSLHPARLPFVEIVCALMSCAFAAVADDSPAGVLPGTTRLELSEPLDVVMVRGISQFAEHESADSAARRESTWPKAKTGTDEFAKWADARSDRLRTIIGAVDSRLSPRLSVLADADSLAADSDRGSPIVRHVEWDVLTGVTARGLLLTPAGQVRGYAVAVPDASWTTEMYCGLTPGVPDTAQLPRRLVERGIVVLVPTLISRSDEFSGRPDIRYTNIPHRELIYRMAFEMGRHVIGYEVQKILAAVDVLEQFATDQEPKPNIGVCGIGDGGQLAMYAAAIDGRIGATLVSGYFQERSNVWREPIDRNIWSQLTNLGDAEIAALATRSGPLFIEAAAAPEWNGPLPAREGRPDYAAPGRITTPPLAAVRAEFDRLKQLAATDRVMLDETDDGTGSPGRTSAFLKFVTQLAEETSTAEVSRQLPPPRTTVDPATREHQQLDELIHFTQRLLHSSDQVRERRWADGDMSNPEAWFKSTMKHREAVHEEMIGRLPVPHAELNLRSRLVIDEPTHTGYEVVMDVIPGKGDDVGIIAGGILLLPKDLQPTERRPVVVCQHGLEGTPMDTITTDESERAWRAYKGFSTALVKRGFIVYAPQNPYRGKHDFRVIQRKSNPLGRSLFTYIIEQHRTTLGWLWTLPNVDVERIAFYGLSYGGKTAVRVPPLLPPLTYKTDDQGHPTDRLMQVPGYCLSICSADFNEWIRKNVTYENRTSYIYTGEYEMFEWNMGHVAGYAELSSLMVPRPFMVERGHDDGVAPDEWVAWEFAKVRRLYDKLGIGERTEIEFFNGPHTINGVGTFDFLHRHLDWPLPKSAVR